MALPPSRGNILNPREMPFAARTPPRYLNVSQKSDVTAARTSTKNLNASQKSDVTAVRTPTKNLSTPAKGDVIAPKRNLNASEKSDVTSSLRQDLEEEDFKKEDDEMDMRSWDDLIKMKKWGDIAEEEDVEEDEAIGMLRLPNDDEESEESASAAIPSVNVRKKIYSPKNILLNPYSFICLQILRFPKIKLEFKTTYTAEVVSVLGPDKVIDNIKHLFDSSCNQLHVSVATCTCVHVGVTPFVGRRR